MNLKQTTHRYCVVGAGASGLTVAKNFRQHGLQFDCIEREDEVGGTWYYGKPGSSVYKSTHLISSKRLTEYTDFPMPAAYPDFPSHEQAWEYLRAYARRFDLYSSIELNRRVERIEPVDDGWRVRLDRGESRDYAGVVIANGHNWDPKVPAYPGTFDGLTLHSSQYKTPDLFRGKRVLVVGAGNSGCDIAVEAAQTAASTFQSSRRSYHYLPKYLLGRPVDHCGERLLRWGVPLWLRRAITKRIVKLSLGSPQDYGLPSPDHELFETHPIINSQMLEYVGQGKICVKPQIERLLGEQVQFVDGSREPIDVLIYATGFRISFPFIDSRHLNWNGSRPELYLHIFHPQHERLFVAGLIQPDSGQWGLVDYQAQLIARYLAALDRRPERAARFRRQLAARRFDLGSGIRYVSSSRHLLEVEHFRYREYLKRLIETI